PWLLLPLGPGLACETPRPAPAATRVVSPAAIRNFFKLSSLNAPAPRGEVTEGSSSTRNVPARSACYRNFLFHRHRGRPEVTHRLDSLQYFGCFEGQRRARGC